MTLDSEFKLKFVVDNFRVYACQECLCLVSWSDRQQHRDKIHPKNPVRNEMEISSPPSNPLPQFPQADTRPIGNHWCVRCRAKEPGGPGDVWWKCCPKHTPEQGTDVVCTLCATIWHPDEQIIQEWGTNGAGEGQEDRVPDSGADEAHGSSADHGRGT